LTISTIKHVLVATCVLLIPISTLGKTTPSATASEAAVAAYCTYPESIAQAEILAGRIDALEQSVANANVSRRRRDAYHRGVAALRAEVEALRAASMTRVEDVNVMRILATPKTRRLFATFAVHPRTDAAGDYFDSTSVGFIWIRAAADLENAVDQPYERQIRACFEGRNHR
jgi:hypothetical protein